MIYFRRLWAKMLTIFFMLWIIVLGLKQVLDLLFNRLSQRGVINNRLNLIDNYWLVISKEYLAGLILLMLLILILWLLLNLITGQLKRDYCSVQLSKHLQRQIVQNSYQMNSIEENKANYWLKRLRIIRWKGRIMVLIPCGPNAAVQRIIKERCEQYLINWLTTNLNGYKWNIKINIHNSIHFNWLYVSEKGKYKR